MPNDDKDVFSGFVFLEYHLGTQNFIDSVFQSITIVLSATSALVSGKSLQANFWVLTSSFLAFWNSQISQDNLIHFLHQTWPKSSLQRSVENGMDRDQNPGPTYVLFPESTLLLHHFLARVRRYEKYVFKILSSNQYL